VNDDDVDHELAHISSHRNPPSTSHKGRIQMIDWDAELEEMSREKAAADASRGDLPTRNGSSVDDWWWFIDLKARFRAKSEKLKAKPISVRDRKYGSLLILTTALRLLNASYIALGDSYVEAPALPTDAPRKEPKEEMEDFLDELLGWWGYPTAWPTHIGSCVILVGSFLALVSSDQNNHSLQTHHNFRVRSGLVYHRFMVTFW